MTDGHSEPRVGMRVVGPDGVEIGLVSAVLPDGILVLVFQRTQTLPREQAISRANVLGVEAGAVQAAVTREAMIDAEGRTGSG